MYNLPRKNILQLLLIFLGMWLLFEVILTCFFGEENVLDIQLHDTYFVIDRRHTLPIFLIIVGYFAYLMLGFWQKFSSRFTTITLLVLNTLFCLLSLSFFALLVFIGVMPGVHDVFPGEFSLFSLFFFLIWIMLPAISLVFVGFQTGKNW